MYKFIYILNLIALLNNHVIAFPGGAPPEACDSLSPERGHGKPSQPLVNVPFSVIQHSLDYSPGQKINLEIVQHNPNINFKGFLVQALDLQSNELIGNFIASDGMIVMDECAAITHSNPKPKQAAKLIWQSPNDRKGQVMFRSTIVVKKDTYYANIPSQVNPTLK